MAKGKKLEIIQNEASASLPEILGESWASSGYTRLGKSVLNVNDRIRLNNIANSECGYSSDINGFVNSKDPILLCRAAYKRFPAFTTAIDILTDISNTEIHINGGNAQANKFIEAWMRKIGIWDVREQFFRECYLSGNIFFQRYDASLKPSDILRMGQVYAVESNKQEVEIPVKYALLDPSTVSVASFDGKMPSYHRAVSAVELAAMKNSGDPTQKEAFKSIKKEIENYVGGTISDNLVKLDPEKIHVVFYQKQDYEPFATPMGFCVLDDINLKMEMRKSDAILARSIELSILVVTAGEKESEGGVDPVVMAALKNQFKNDKIGRVLVGDYTTKVQFVSPDIATLMGPQKYEDVNASISSGLMNIFFGEQKFADSVNKLRAISKKVQNAQNLFLTKFLNPEIKRISKLMGFKAYPTAVMEPVRIDDQTNMMRIYAQLMQMGALSPKDGIELMESGILPKYDVMELNQDVYKKARDKGFFQPVQGGPFDAKEAAKISADFKAKQAKQTQQAGRPAGTQSPQTTKKVSQIGASEHDDAFSQKKLVSNTTKFHNLKKSFTLAYKDKFDIKKITASNRNDIDSKLLILSSQVSPEEWNESIAKYLEPKVEDITLLDSDIEIARISAEYDISTQDATILYHSKI